MQAKSWRSSNGTYPNMYPDLDPSYHRGGLAGAALRSRKVSLRLSTSAVNAMDSQGHWEKIYSEKAPDTVSWYRPHLETSLELIERLAPAKAAAIIDVGGGESTLVDDLLARGYQSLTVLDISQTAVVANRKRLGNDCDRVMWIVGDITKLELGPEAYDVWHDRAVFHFLTAPHDRSAYVRQVARAVKP